MLHQVSIFAANTKGALSRMTTILAKNDINIYTMLATDSAEFGIIRLIVDKSEEAMKALEEAGYQCRVDLVLAVDMKSDKPGTLDNILSDLQNANVMIRYLYISFVLQFCSLFAVFSSAESETEAFLKGKVYHLLDRF